MKTTFRPLFACAAAGALAVSLAGCGPDDAQEAASTQMALTDGLAPGWSMMDLAGADPAIYDNDDGPLPEALPMTASYGGGYGYAPTYDYAPDDGGSYYEPLDDSYYYDDGYDDGYYAEPYDAGYGDGGLLGLGGDGNGLALLAVATALTGVLGDAPPDYGFAYDGVSPWAWETGDRYYRYAEPVHGGYRYYYYEPDAYRPFFVSDPYYSYGYRDDRVVAIYDREGRRIDARRAQLQLQAANDYYARAERLHRAAQHDRRGISAPRWARQRDTIARDRRDWVEKVARHPGLQKWEARNAPKVQRQWANEALVRRDAERSFAKWQRADYRTPAPKLYTPQVRQEQVRKIADLRQSHAKELADRRRERAEKQREVPQEAQRIAQRTERAAPRSPKQPAVRAQIERQRALRQDHSRAAVTAPANRVGERVATKQQSARAAIAAPRPDRKAVQAQRVANRAVDERKAEAAKAQRQAPPAKPAAHQSVMRPAPAAEHSARATGAERQQSLQKRQKVQQEAKAERAKQTAAEQRERSARQEQTRVNVERQQARASSQASANSARQEVAKRRQEQAEQRQAQAAQRQRSQAEQRQQSRAAQRQRAQAEQRQAQAPLRQPQVQQRGEARQNAREERRNQRRGDRN